MDGYFLYIADRLDRIRVGEGKGKFDLLGELKSWELWRAVLAEGVATMLFVFIGTASAVLPVGEALSAAVIVRIAFTFGLMITVLIQMFGHVSGGHMNPAVSVAMAVALKISPIRAILYTLTQCVGGILGSLILKGVTPSETHSNLGVTSSPLLDAGQAFGCEVIFTFILVFSIFGCTDGNRPFFGSPALGIGLTVGVMHLAGIPYTGASMNPARSLGSAVISQSFVRHWVYWVGPLLGGCVAALSYKYVFDPYRGGVSMDQAIDKLMGDGDMIVIPKTYFKDSQQKPKVDSSINL